MNREHFIYLFQRYVNDQASKEEIGELIRMVNSGEYDEWIKDHIDMMLPDAGKYKHQEDGDMPVHAAEKILREILHTGSGGDSVQGLQMYKTWKKKSAVSSWRWVAAVGVMLMAGFFWVYFTTITGGSDTNGPNEVAMQEIITNRGERTSLILGDGSRVTLNAESRLKIPLDYGQHSRTLILHGEAFFEVKSNPEQPFRVNTSDDVYTEVLGTQFNVRSYNTAALSGMEASGGKADVVVAEGSVRLGSENQNQPNSVVVSAGQKGMIGANGAIAVSAVPDLDVYLGWIQGRLVFNDHTFEEVTEELERWYDIKITVTDSLLLKRRLSAIFEDDPLSEVLQVIAQSFQIDFIQEKRHVKFSSYE